MKFWIDLKYAVRLLLKKPSFTALTVAIMACGLALCIYMFVVIYTIGFKPLDFPNGERMVVIDMQLDNVLYNGGQVRYAHYLDVKQQNQSFATLGAMQQSIFTVSGGDRAASYRGVLAQPDLFSYTSTQPIMGRLFNQQDDQPGAAEVALIGYDLWQDYFAGRQDIIGHPFELNGKQTEIIGVMPADYLFPRASQIWQPIRFESAQYTREKGPSVDVYGLLKPGVTIDQANGELRQIVNQTNLHYPDENKGETLVANTFMISAMGAGVQPILLSMNIAVLFVLLLACTNVTNLLYARSTERAKETAVRVALGAPQSRLVMQMLWESLIICSLGGVFGLLLAAYGLEITNQILPTFVNSRPPYWWHISLDSTVVILTLGLTLLTALITGILPALKISKGDFNAILRDGTRGAQSRKAKKMSQLLVIIEVALSIGLLTASAMMTMAIQSANNADYGASTDNILTARIALSAQNYATTAQQINYFKQITAALQQLPEVSGVAVMSRLPGQSGPYLAVTTEGLETSNKNTAPRANAVWVMPGSLSTFEIPLIEGRYFSASDNSSNEKVVIVSQNFAEKYWPKEASVLGKRLQWASDESQQWYRVIGVVGNVLHGQPYADFKYRSVIYRSNLQEAQSYLSVAVKTRADLDSLMQPMLATINSIDGNVPAFRVATMAQNIERNTAGMNFVIQLFMIFGITATLLAASGIYGLMANAVSQRTQELGIRRALGASDSLIIKMLMKQGIWQFVIGAIVGLPIAFLFGNMVVGVIGVEDISIYVVFALIPLGIAAVVISATYIPAARVVKPEPNIALRYE